MHLQESADVSVIIVTAAKNRYLSDCLDSLLKQSGHIREIIVIDNSCQKSFRKEILKDYPQVRMFSPAQNLFYSQSLNLGISESTGDFILCLNDDVTLKADFIASALKGFFLDKRIGMVSGKIMRSDGKTIDSTGLFLSYCRSAKERGYSKTDNGKFVKAGYVFGVNGAVAFYRKKMLEDIKEDNDYFDSNLGFFYEDLDVAWRANLRAWKGYYLPQALAFHVRGGTARSKKNIGRKIARHYLADKLYLGLVKNRYIVMIKNETIASFIMHLPGIIFYDLLTWLDIIFFRPRLIKSFILHKKCIKSAFKKRKTIFSRR